MKALIIVFFTIATLMSCRQQQIKKEMTQIIGHEFYMPDSLCCILNGQKIAVNDSFMNARIKLVVLYDSSACYGCRIKRLGEWDEMTALAMERSDFKVFFIFSVRDPDKQPIIASLKAARLNYPVFLDCESRLFKRNPMVQKERYHTFLLDSQNKVVLVGSPVGNESLMELYDGQITRLMRQE